MQLITLNIWGGKVYGPLMDFLEKHSTDTDIFCFQEVLFGSQEEFTPLHRARINIFSEIKKRLSDFVAIAYHAPEEAIHFMREPLPENTRPGQAIFVRKPLKVVADGGFRGYQQSNTVGVDFGGKITGSCQWIIIQAKESGNVTILNLHGLSQKDTKKADTPERLTQSQILHNFMSSKNGKKILCGDFNLQPNGESMKILEKGMTNLVKKFKITSTRSKLYPKPERFADYVLTSPGVRIDSFEVLPDEVSDHLPLLLKFE